MKTCPQRRITAAAIGCIACVAQAQAAANWPQFRGPNASGIAEDAKPPVHFGANTNLLWKTAVPRGVSAPVIWVVEPKTGKRLLDRERLGTVGQAVASPIAANGYIYTVNESGTFTVLRAGDTLDVAAVNKLGESVRATPAIAGDTLYVRTAGHLWAFGEKQPTKR